MSPPVYGIPLSPATVSGARGTLQQAFEPPSTEPEQSMRSRPSQLNIVYLDQITANDVIIGESGLAKNNDGNNRLGMLVLEGLDDARCARHQGALDVFAIGIVERVENRGGRFLHPQICQIIEGVNETFFTEVTSEKIKLKAIRSVLRKIEPSPEKKAGASVNLQPDLGVPVLDGSARSRKRNTHGSNKLSLVEVNKRQKTGSNAFGPRSRFDMQHQPPQRTPFDTSRNYPYPSHPRYSHHSHHSYHPTEYPGAFFGSHPGNSFFTEPSERREPYHNSYGYNQAPHQMSSQQPQGNASVPTGFDGMPLTSSDHDEFIYNGRPWNFETDQS